MRGITRHRSRTPGSGFTLVELLVVIAILSVLVAFLLPVLRRAVEGARDVACRNNLKQIGVGFKMYADDFQGWVVVANSDTGGFHPPPVGYRMWHNWSLVSQGYLDTVIDPPYADTNAEWSVLPTKGLFACPAEQGLRTVMWCKTTYGINMGVSYGFGTPGYTSTRFWEFRRPGSTCIVGDSGGSNSALYVNYKNYDPAQRHAGRWNLLYADLRVDALPTFPDVYGDILWQVDGE